MDKKQVVIVGAGVVGPLLAIYLAKKGLHVDLYERRPDTRKAENKEQASGRSINLVLSTRGIHALNELGLFAGLADKIISIKGRMIHTKEGIQHFVPYTKKESTVYSILRSELSHYLLNHAETFPNIKLFFNEKCLKVDFKKNLVLFENTQTEREHTIPLNVLFATDGMGSNVRRSMISLPRFNFSQDYHDHSYKELLLPSDANQDYQLDKHGFHLWPRGKFMFQAQANLDGSFTCSLFLQYKGDPSYESLTTPEAVEVFFKEQFCDVPPLIPDLTTQFFNHVIGHFVTIKCFPWHYKDNVLLLGDAAHAIGPYYGQGMNCGFEDCTMLNKSIEKFEGNWEKIFIDYENRKKDTDVIAELERENFIELRDLAQDPKFILKRNLELLLEEAYPNQYLSKYSMVVLNRLPYSMAGTRGRIQDQILMDMCSKVESLEEFDLKEVKNKLDQVLSSIEMQ